MPKEWKDWDDKDLAEEAQIGLRGQGALVEMMRRLKDSTKFLSWVMVVLAILQVLLAALQIVLTIFELPKFKLLLSLFAY